MARVKGNNGQKSARSAAPPRRYVAVGDVFRSGESVYAVVERRGVWSPMQACLGCAFRDRFCPNVPCSAFDRPDGTFVWFVAVEE